MGGVTNAPMAPTTLSEILGRSPPPPAFSLGYILGEPTGPYRSRTDWNNRFTYWEKPASVSEEGTIERAQSNVISAIINNLWLSDQQVLIQPQGSYHNNTNVRTEADIDLRAVHPALKIEYNTNVHIQTARTALGYGDYGLTFQYIFINLRAELIAELSRKFGSANVISGKKAIRIKGITGSRAEVDVVPTIRFHYVDWISYLNRYNTTEGVAILSTEGLWTLNFPEQHTANGVAKRARTAHRFKKVVRVLKRIRADMTDSRILTVNVPSFLVECLVYGVEDAYFLVKEDDRYDRVRRVSLRIQEMLSNSTIAAKTTEINEIKKLFHPDQGWTLATAQTFANAVVAHLGDA